MSYANHRVARLRPLHQRPAVRLGGRPAARKDHDPSKQALAVGLRPHALVLYEPTLFSVLDEERPSPNEADGIRHVVADAGAAIDASLPERPGWL